MLVPQTGLPKALFIIDVQPATFTHPNAHAITQRIIAYIGKTSYDAYVVAEYHAPKGSMFDKQLDFVMTRKETGATDATVLQALEPFREKLITVEKTTRSVFKNDHASALHDFLKNRGIGEIHAVGFDVDDCVLATLYDASDLGYYAFLLEELAGRFDGETEMEQAALKLFHHTAMTNNALEDKIPFTTVDL